MPKAWCGAFKVSLLFYAVKGLSGFSAVTEDRPDLAQKLVEDPMTRQKRHIRLGEDHKGRQVHPDRDVWVLRVVDVRGEVLNATADADSVLQLLKLRLAYLRKGQGDTGYATLDCIFELARRLHGRAQHEAAEGLYRECLAGCQGLRGSCTPHPR